MEPRHVFIDTSAFYAALDGDDRFHPRAMSGWQQLQQEAWQLHTSNYVLVESVALLQRRIGLDAVRALSDGFVPLMTLHAIDPQDHQAALQALLTADRRKLSLVDCTSFITMRQHAIHVAFTFDKHFTEQGFQPLPRPRATASGRTGALR
ncbi:MAG: type II toxin-antitoxin system VapC family toxin [Polyangiales bacterium]